MSQFQQTFFCRIGIIFKWANLSSLLIASYKVILEAPGISTSSKLMWVVTCTEFKQRCQIFFKSVLNNLSKDRSYRFKTNCFFGRMCCFCFGGGMLVFLFTVRIMFLAQYLLLSNVIYRSLYNLKSKFCYAILFLSTIMWSRYYLKWLLFTFLISRVRMKIWAFWF